MEINEYEAGMLDAVLEAFAGRTQLDWTELMQLFDGDEELAAAITDILAGMNLVIKSGEETKTGLPEKITRTDKVAEFIERGGFSAQVNNDEQLPAIQPPAPKPIEEQPLPNREIVFEIENKLTKESPAEAAAPLAPVSMAILPVEDDQPVAEKVKIAPDALLEQEIAHLRLEQRKFEHRLREKDINIKTLTDQTETLGRFRLFIWVLLGLIALLIIGLIFRK